MPYQLSVQSVNFVDPDILEWNFPDLESIRERMQDWVTTYPLKPGFKFIIEIVEDEVDVINGEHYVGEPRSEYFILFHNHKTNKPGYVEFDTYEELVNYEPSSDNIEITCSAC